MVFWATGLCFFQSLVVSNRLIKWPTATPRQYAPGLRYFFVLCSYVTCRVPLTRWTTVASFLVYREPPLLFQGHRARSTKAAGSVTFTGARVGCIKTLHRHHHRHQRWHQRREDFVHVMLERARDNSPPAGCTLDTDSEMSRLLARVARNVHPCCVP